MQYVTIEDLKHLAYGAAVLGSGGGGGTDYELLMAEKQLMDHGNVRLASVDELRDDALVLPIAFAGAPLVGIEMFPSGLECAQIIDAVEKCLGRKPTHLMPAEIGGANAFCPFLYASRLGLPVVDGDTIGRAFPEIQMSSCNLFDVATKPAFVADCLGNDVVINAGDARTLEDIARKNVVAMGSSALVGVYLMDGHTAKTAVVQGSITKAIQIGTCVHTAKRNGVDPIQALIDDQQGRLLGHGIIIDITQTIEDGFLKGTVRVMADEGTLEIAYQNEYLKAATPDHVLGLTPEIICVLDTASALPITSERLLFGLRVTVIALPAPAVWTTPQGLQLVGPEYFGYHTTEVAPC